MSFRFASGNRTARRSPSLSDELIQRAPFPAAERTLTESLRARITALRPHLLDFLRLDKPAPPHALTFAGQSQPIALHSLPAIWPDHICHHQPTQPHEQKPLLSPWTQWYISLSVPPLMPILLSGPQRLNLAPGHFHVESHESGQAACFWIDVHNDVRIVAFSPQARIDALVIRTLQPVIEALEATSEINGRLIWSNTGYLISWYLGEMRTQLGDEQVAVLRQHCFSERQLAGDQDDPLWRTVMLREGLLVRRTCYQRYRLPDVQQYGDCTLE